MTKQTGCKTLVCEDDPIGRRVVQLFLQPYGECATCTTGPEAVALFEEALVAGRSFSLALLDVSVPKLSGIEVLKRIRELETQYSAAKPCAAVMLTGRREPAFMEEAKKFGCDRYLLKPIAESALLGELQALGIISGGGEGAE